MHTTYVSASSMSSFFRVDKPDLNDAPSDETIFIPSQSSISEGEESDGLQVERGPQVEGVSGHLLVSTFGDIQCPFSAYRRTKCKVKLYVSDLGAIDTGHHTENCVPGFCRAPAGSSPTITDLLEEIMLVMDTFCGRDVTLTPTEVWRTARDQFYGDSKEIAMGAAQRQILGRLYRIRAKAFGWANFGRLERATLRRQRQYQIEVFPI
ncbi:hypothetical protein GN244_ATG19093 [Phytophthora infestans]|uniref:Uncharacterized protein n=1 Tax=Phytophthora infestans TaxID=4787 RepID=A0A833RYS2_PHYIN|nr:hypothetical protein GN244_ATG19093 [Phytophthora infestans]